MKIHFIYVFVCLLKKPVLPYHTDNYFADFGFIAYLNHDCVCCHLQVCQPCIIQGYTWNGKLVLKGWNKRAPSHSGMTCNVTQGSLTHRLISPFKQHFSNFFPSHYWNVFFSGDPWQSSSVLEVIQLVAGTPVSQSARLPWPTDGLPLTTQKVAFSPATELLCSVLLY